MGLGALLSKLISKIVGPSDKEIAEAFETARQNSYNNLDAESKAWVDAHQTDSGMLKTGDAQPFQTSGYLQHLDKDGNLPEVPPHVTVTNSEPHFLPSDAPTQKIEDDCLQDGPECNDDCAIDGSSLTSCESPMTDDSGWDAPSPKSPKTKKARKTKAEKPSKESKTKSSKKSSKKRKKLGK